MPPSNPYDHQFRRLMDLGDSAEGNALFAELLRNSAHVLEPLSEFLIRQQHDPRCAVLLHLLGKCMDPRGLSVLMKFLESPEPELRRAAANALGWNRARAGLEMLDNLEGNDPDERVRQEARAAIEEILTDYPKLRDMLRHHKAAAHSSAERHISGEYDKGPAGAPDREQALKLMATLPRLLALKYRAVPLHFSPNDQLHVAVRLGSERRLVPTLSEITGHHVELHGWTEERILQAIDQLYSLGDDDFATFHDKLTALARDEVVELVLNGVRPNEPTVPLTEVNDAVEGVQAFLTACAQSNAHRARIEFTPPSMKIVFENTTKVQEIDPPDGKNRERFLSTLRILAGLNPGAGLGEQDGGRIRCASCEPAYVAHVKCSKRLEGETVELSFARE